MENRLITFKNYKDEDYELVINFLIELNKKDDSHINWNWARFEWMYEHPEFNKELKPYIGMWFDKEKLVGLVAFDMYFGEVSCLVLPEFDYLYKDLVKYSWENLKDENGLGISINDESEKEIEVLKSLGFEKAEACETIMTIDLDKEFEVKLPDDLKIVEVDQHKDYQRLSWLFWQGFGHGDNKEECEEVNDVEYNGRVHFNPHLSLAAENKDGDFASFAGLWYHPDTDYAYVEPVCTIPSYRGKGIAKALIYEELNRARSMGAKKAYVISDQEFYKKLGFKIEQKHTFWWKK